MARYERRTSRREKFWYASGFYVASMTITAGGCDFLASNGFSDENNHDMTIERWTGSISLRTNSSGINGFLVGFLSQEELSTSDVENIGNDIWVPNKEASFPVVVPLSLPPNNSWTWQFDQRAKRRRLRGEKVNWCCVTANAVTNGIQVYGSVRFLCNVD